MCVGGGKAQMQNKNRYSDLRLHQPVYKTEQQVRCGERVWAGNVTVCACLEVFSNQISLSASYNTNEVSQYRLMVSVEER